MWDMAVQSQIVYFGTELFDILLHFDMSHMQEINEKKNVEAKMPWMFSICCHLIVSSNG